MLLLGTTGVRGGAEGVAGITSSLLVYSSSKIRSEERIILAPKKTIAANFYGGEGETSPS
ncbi:hypothetical protein HMPREF9554_02733 [Treponema phagedenis F0421]|nr:hypothetical protein HMPREF9554_02733 [Treponema phagedenis F0421]